MRLLSFITVGLCTLLPTVTADLYLQYPRGGNNRLDEANRDRQNGNRLFDSENNNRGGVNAGNYRDRQYFYEGSVMPVSWTVQHGCDKAIGSCSIIMQYMCSNNEFRDGIFPDTNTITDADEPTRGKHETSEYYYNCIYRQRNKGLFTADQQMRNRPPGGRFTRQDNNGNRYGWECPEERDYYPYWNPSPWIDVAILTTDVERCPAYQAESQNVKGRWYCVAENKDKREGYIPITREQCENAAIKGTWTYVPPFNVANPSITAPDCRKVQPSRDNHHGNVNGSPYVASYNWTIPSVYGESCVFRMRYNITTGDFPYGGFDSWTTLGTALNKDDNRAGDENDQGDSDQIGFFQPAEYDVWTRYGLNYSTIAPSFRRPDNNPTKDEIMANQYASRGYVFKGQNSDEQTPTNRYPQVNIFGSLVPQASVRLQLAFDTSQYGRTFQDRTHVFSIRKRLDQHQGMKIYNVGVRGKRGNIVQTYPSTEYDFVPERLHIKQGDLIHFQWMGSDNAGDNAGQAPNNKDRSNIVILRKHQYNEYGADEAHGVAPVSTQVGHLGQMYPGFINDTANYPFLGFGFQDLQLLALQGLNFSYFDLGPRQVTRPGIYHYLGTRNNAFSNRNQAATIVVDVNDQFIPAAASYSDPAKTWTSNGWLYAGDTNVDGVLTGSKLEMIDLGSDGDSHIHQVLPMQFTVGPGQTLLINIKHKRVGLAIGRMFWRADPADSWVEVSGYKDEGDYTSYPVTATSQTSGGYYKVINGPNGPAIAGVVIGILAFFAIVIAVFWKLRVQPNGGWSIWWASVRPRGSSATSPTKKLEAYNTDSHKDAIPLSSPSAATSSGHHKLESTGSSAPALPTAPKPQFTPNPATVNTAGGYSMPHMAHSRV